MPAKNHKKRKNTYYPDMCFALILPLAMATNLYGFRALLLFATSVISAVVFDYIGCRIIKHKAKIKTGQSIFIGGLLALLLPATAPLWLVVVGNAFSVLLVKTAFGGVGSSPFSCTASGFAFLAISCPKEVFNYPDLNSQEFVSGVTVAQSLRGGNPSVTAVELINAFIGTVPGAMGATSTVILLGLLVYIIFKRPKSFINSFSFLITVFIFNVILTAVYSTDFFTVNTFRVICLRMCSGFTMLLAVFFVTEDPLSPRKNAHRIIFGAILGVIYIVLNQISVYEETGCFAVLILNAVFPIVEKYLFKKHNKREVVAVEKTQTS